MTKKIPWKRIEATPGLTFPEATLGTEYFSGGNPQDQTDRLIKELIPNSKDASTNGFIEIAISIGEVSGDAIRRHFGDLSDDLKAEGATGRARYQHIDMDADRIRAMVFEDFGTMGLAGDIHNTVIATKKDLEGNNWGGFWFLDGASSGAGKGGRGGKHGIGKNSLLLNSGISAFAVNTVWNPSKGLGNFDLLMGRAALFTRKVKEKVYLPPAWMCENPTAVNFAPLPIEDVVTIDQFRKDFGLVRTNGEAGTSIVVPFLNEQITIDTVEAAVATQFTRLLLEGKVRCEIGPIGGLSHGK
jgi:hypothetical protein